MENTGSDSSANSPNVVRCSFGFDHELLKAYFALFLRPHDKESGRRLAALYAGLLLFLVPFLVVSAITLAGFSSLDGAYERKFVVFAVLLVALSITVARSFCKGMMMLFGLRRPNWEGKRWGRKADLAFSRFRAYDEENPLRYNVPASLAEEDGHPKLVFRWWGLVDAPALSVALHGTDEFDKPVAFDIVSGLLPRYPDLPGAGAPPPVTFSAAFHPGHIEKGSHGAVFARSYAEVHDVVEDSRYPGLAIVRHENGYGQLVVRTDLLEGGTWDEVKSRIAAAKGRAG